jgi:hypothetical protein
MYLVVKIIKSRRKWYGGDVDWIGLAQDRKQVVSSCEFGSVLNLWVP